MSYLVLFLRYSEISVENRKF